MIRLGKGAGPRMNRCMFSDGPSFSLLPGVAASLFTKVGMQESLLLAMRGLGELVDVVRASQK